MSKVSICYKYDYDCIREVEVPDGEHIYPGYTGTFVLYADPGFKERINLDEFVVNGDIHLFIDHTTYFSKLGSSTIYATDEIQPYLGNSIVNNGEDIVVFNGYFPNKPYLISTQHTVHRYDIVGISSSQLRSLSIESLYDYIDTQVIEIKTQNYVMDGKLILRTALNTYEGFDYSDNNVPGFDDFLENIDVFKDEACTISAYPDIDSGNFRTNDLVNPDLDTIYCRFKSDCNYTLDDFVTIDFKEREDLGRTVVLLKNKHTTFKDTNLIYHGDWFQDTPGRDFIVPIPKTNDGTVFEGWYYDKELTHKLSVDDPIPDHDTVFYPKFVEDKATVKYWTVTITEAGYPDKTYTVKDGCCLPVEAFISSNPNKFSSGVKETYDDINHPYNITCDCTFTLDGTGVVLEDGYLPTNMRESFNYDGYVAVEYNSSTQEFIPTGIGYGSRSMYIYAFDHNYNIVDEKTGTVGFINIRPMPDKDLPDIEGICGWLGDVVTSQDVLTLISKKILLEPGARFKLYTYNSTYVPGTGWIDEYIPSSLFSSGSEVITPDPGYTSYYYEILPPLPPPAHITLVPNPTEVNNSITLRVTEIIDVTLHSAYNESTEDVLVKEVLSKYAETNDISLGRHKVGDTISLNFKDFAGNDIPIINLLQSKLPDKDLQSKIGINKLFMACMSVGIDINYFNESLPVLITDAPGTGIKLNYEYLYLNLILNLNITDKTGRIIEYDEISYRIAGTVLETVFPDIDTSTVVKTQDKQVTIPCVIIESSGKLQSLPGYGIEIIVSAKGYQQFKQTFAVKDMLTSDDLSILSVMTFIKSSIPIEIQMEPESYAISIVQGTGGTISASAATATMGTQITLTATPSAGYEFISWNITGPYGLITVIDNEFVMPGGNVIISAAFRPIGNPIVVGFALDRELMKTDPAGCLTYIREAEGLIPMTASDEGSWAGAWPFNTIRPVVFNNDGSVYKYLSKVNLSQYEDGTSATTELASASYDTFVEFQKIYQKVIVEGNVSTLYLSDAPGDGFTLHPAFLVDGVEKDKIYIGRYAGYNSSSKLYSCSGVSPAVDKTLSQFRTFAQSRGSGYSQISYYDWDLVAKLYVLGFKNLDSQSALGQGYSGASDIQRTGTTDSQKWNYGSTSPTISVSLFGLEDWWGNIYILIDNFINLNGIIKAGSLSAPNDAGTGYDTIAEYSDNSGGYVLSCRGGLNDFFLLDNDGGSPTIGLCDSQFIFRNGNYCGLIGGAWDDEDDAGIFRLNIYLSTDYHGSSVGARLAYKP